MKRVIDGRPYNTETAESIANYRNNLPSTDFRFADETLYKTKNGRFFLHGQGGAMTRWCESAGNTSWGSSGIERLSETEALDWCESCDVDADIIAKHFTLEDA